jgi:hypothetical protein
MTVRSASPGLAGQFSVGVNTQGYNYTVLESRGTAADCQNRHVTFEVNKYNSYEAGRFLDDMVTGGFNTARVMIDFGDACRQAVGQ